MNNSSLVHLNDNQSILFVRLIILGYLGFLLSVFGIIGNFLTIFVLSFQPMRHTSTNIYLISLSCSNIIFLIVFFLSDSMKAFFDYFYYHFYEQSRGFNRFLRLIPIDGLHYSSLFSIIYLTIGVSIDRLICIRCPFTAKRILTKTRTFQIIIVIYFCSIIYSLPLWFQKTPSFSFHLRKLRKYIQIYFSIPLLYIIPLIILTFVNIDIILNLIKKKHRRICLHIQTTNGDQVENYIILIIATGTIIFSLCQIPFFVLNTWYALDPINALKNQFFYYILIFGIILFALNTSTSFIVQFLLRKQFRDILFGCKKSDIRILTLEEKHLIVPFKK